MEAAALGRRTRPQPDHERGKGQCASREHDRSLTLYRAPWREMLLHMATPGVSPRANGIALWILAVVALLFFLRAASQLMIPIVIGVLISYALEPVVAWLARHGVPRVAGTSVILLGLLGVCALGAYSLRDDVRAALDSLPEAARRAREMASSQWGSTGSSSIQEAASILQGTSGDDRRGQTGSGAGAATGPQSSDGSQAARDGRAQEESASAAGSSTSGAGPPGAGGSAATTVIRWGVGSLVSLAGHLTVIFFLVFFLLLSGHHFRDRLVEIAGSGDRRETTAAIVDDINEQIQRFLLVRLVTGVFVGVLTWAVLAWMGVQQAAVWGILAGVFNSIPYFGPIIVSGGLLVIGLAQGGGLTQAVQMAGAALVITSVEGWLLEPPLMGKAERMSAIAVFLGLLLWSWVWGAWGTILAVPMLVVVKSVADHVRALRPVGRLMAP
jgi:predicted PurR-regulated permease PerM